jgi:uncharacterized protein YsxB (DUF464 family)
MFIIALLLDYSLEYQGVCSSVTFIVMCGLNKTKGICQSQFDLEETEQRNYLSCAVDVTCLTIQYIYIFKKSKQIRVSLLTG